MRNRGRPKHADDAGLAAQNHAIGRTVYQLTLCGFPRRGSRGIFAQIAKLAPTILPGERSKLSGVRVEEIYESWLLANPLMPRRVSYTRESLRTKVAPPGGRLELLSRALLSNNGEWTLALLEQLWRDDPEHTERAHAEFAKEFGVEK